MQTEPQESTVDRKVLTLVGIVLALLMVAICFVAFLLIRSILADRQTVQPLPPAQVVIPTLAPAANPQTSFVPVIMNVESQEVQNLPIPIVTTVWRFLSIDEDDIGTFENVGDPSKRLIAECIDPKRPDPVRGALYDLDDSGILKPQEGNKKFQRFEVID